MIFCRRKRSMLNAYYYIRIAYFFPTIYFLLNNIFLIISDDWRQLHQRDEFESICFLIEVFTVIRLAYAIVILLCTGCLIALACYFYSGYGDNLADMEDMDSIRSKNSAMVTRLRTSIKRNLSFNSSVRKAVQCSICLEEFGPASAKELCEVACSGRHIFHVSCITDWAYKGHNDCPMCR